MPQPLRSLEEPDQERQSGQRAMWAHAGKGRVMNTRGASNVDQTLCLALPGGLLQSPHCHPMPWALPISQSGMLDRE